MKVYELGRDICSLIYTRDRVAHGRTSVDKLRSYRQLWRYFAKAFLEFSPSRSDGACRSAFWACGSDVCQLARHGRSCPAHADAAPIEEPFTKRTVPASGLDLRVPL